eukprot:GHVQ01020576.1.p1 GENE.GHVQ01020576.1~~GHVQ01020576.1.p1  ORF type:complete len:276 (+),score=58.43 GHVQ01020576.1:78-905(+)
MTMSMDIVESFDVLTDLEKRLTACEEAAGIKVLPPLRPYTLTSLTSTKTDTKQKEDEEKEAGTATRDIVEGGGAEGGGLTEGRSDLTSVGVCEGEVSAVDSGGERRVGAGDGKFVVGGGSGGSAGGGTVAKGGSRSGSSLSVQVEQLRNRMNKVMQGPMLEFENTYSQVRVYMESEHALLSSTLLSLEAKRGYVVENETFMRETSQKLKEFDSLKQYANPPEVSDLQAYQKRLDALEDNGRRLRRKAMNISTRMTELSQTYNETVCAYIYKHMYN